MTTPNEKMTAAAAVSGVRVSATATEQADGSVKCKVTCNEQVAWLTFTGTDVMVDVPEVSSG